MSLRKKAISCILGFLVVAILNSAFIFSMRIFENTYSDEAVAIGSISEILLSDNNKIAPGDYVLSNWMASKDYKDAGEFFSILQNSNYKHLNRFQNALIQSVQTKQNSIAEISLDINSNNKFADLDVTDYITLCKNAANRCEVLKIGDTYYLKITVITNMNTDKPNGVYSVETYKAADSEAISQIDALKGNKVYYEREFPAFFEGIFATGYLLAAYIISVILEAAAASFGIYKLQNVRRRKRNTETALSK